MTRTLSDLTSDEWQSIATAAGEEALARIRKDGGEVTGTARLFFEGRVLEVVATISPGRIVVEDVLDDLTPISASQTPRPKAVFEPSIDNRQRRDNVAQSAQRHIASPTK
jgi:hypothetical protein